MNWQEKWQLSRERKSFLALADGSVFFGYSVGYSNDCFGEVVFNTSLSGYEEILSDPSYAGQFVVMTAPEIGNVGINAEDMESEKFQAAGLLVENLNGMSNWRAQSELSDSLKQNKLPALAGIDTRALTILLREKGTQKAYLSVSGKVSVEEAVERAKNWEGLDGIDYAERVSCKSPYQVPDSLLKGFSLPEILPEKTYRLALYDFGVKWNILRQLRFAGFDVTVFPAKTPAKEILAGNFDGVFFSNGPGDPSAVHYAIESAKELLGKLPVMGICLGHQILGLALGAQTGRLKFGHHGGNHPVKFLDSGRVMVTSQNHNFAVLEESIGSDLEITHINLNDHSIEGFRSKKFPMISVQFHPEAAPGPNDSAPFFDDCRKLVETFKPNQ